MNTIYKDAVDQHMHFALYLNLNLNWLYWSTCSSLTKIPVVNITLQQVLSLLASCRHAGIALDFGDGLMTVAPFQPNLLGIWNRVLFTIVYTSVYKSVMKYPVDFHSKRFLLQRYLIMQEVTRCIRASVSDYNKIWFLAWFPFSVKANKTVMEPAERYTIRSG